ncbi:MAG: PH domain-containing protein [Phycisphaeraceae bacterium]|nr:PH domain-containing protein [Phycisphaeraceae bacterium]
MTKALQNQVMGPVESCAAWIYEGVWGILADLLRTPRQPPLLPSAPDEETVSLKPSQAWLRYLKFWFWIGLTIIDAVILGGWLIILFVNPVVGAILAVPAWIVAFVPDIFAYIAIHLRYDTTWYIISPRSIRLRNGIWVIRETTFTFENVQNVEITQGPVERWFGFANLKVETAGGGVVHTQHGAHPDGSNVAFLFGLENAHEIRKTVMERVAASRTTGIGDESARHVTEAAASTAPSRLSAEHLAELRAMRDRLRTALGESAA